MRMFVSMLLVLSFSSFAFGQEPLSVRITKLEEANTAIQTQLNGISSVQDRIQSDVTDLKAELKAVSGKLDALAKVTAPQAKFAASTQDEWGNGALAAFATAPAVPVSQPMTSHSSMMMSAGTGSCSSGSCGGSSSGMGRMMGRRR